MFSHYFHFVESIDQQLCTLPTVCEVSLHGGTGTGHHCKGQNGIELYDFAWCDIKDLSLGSGLHSTKGTQKSKRRCVAEEQCAQRVGRTSEVIKQSRQVF